MTDSTNRRVATWLLVCCALVFAMVILGGVTRLTGSGLSMVDWRPVTGWLPPMSESEWQRTFEMYRQTPEFREVNSHMDVHAFKGIFWLEYLHRLFGRLIGIAFIVPFIVFALRGDIVRSHWPRYLGMFALGGLQGVLGWYMVKSGLVDVPNVSQYRLTAHLVLAFLIFSLMLWEALSLLYPRHSGERHPWFGRAAALTALTGTTIVSGGFVAGLDAGRIFNSFPKMGEHWIAPGVMALDPWWRNFFENPALVQFDHRLLATTTFIAIVAFWIMAQRATDLPGRARRAANWLLAAVVAQVALGIATLLAHVPIVLGAAHQATAMLLLTSTLLVLHALRSAPAAESIEPAARNDRQRDEATPAIG